MTELAVGYVSLVATTDKIPPAVRKALGQAEGEAEKSGKAMGSKMSGALGKALKTGGAAAAAAGVATIGTAMVKGFQRLSAIDDAKGKLAGLGVTAADTSKIMDSALTAVRGTAFGLGDAATIAGNAVAAGIKPGQELTKYLSMTADAASIAGVSLSDMGSILNQVQTGQMAYTDDLNQLADRGIPIYQWLAKEAGVTGAEVKKMASDGKISSEMFFAAIQKNIGGAAQEAGKTVRGGFQNMIAALGRLGAAAEQPFFSRLPGMLAGATTAIDNMTPTVTRLAEALDQKIFEEWGPKLQSAMQAARDSGAIDELLSTLKGMAQAGIDVMPALTGIGQALAQASATIGIGTWQLFLTTLQAATGVLNIINPGLQTLADLMKAHPALVTAALGAWVGFKTVPGMISKVSDVLSPLTSRVTGARDAFKGFGEQMTLQRTLAANNGIELGRFGGAMAVVRTRASGMRQALQGSLDVLGGPWGAAATGATVAGGLLVASFQRQSQISAEYDSAVKKLTESHYALSKALIASQGVATEDVMKIATQRVDEYREKTDAAARADGKWHEVMYDGIGKFLGLTKAGEGLADMNDRAAAKAQGAQHAFDQLGMSTEDVSKKLYGSQREWNILQSQLMAMGPAGMQAVSDLRVLRNEFVQQQNIAKQMTPGFTEVSDAIKTLGDESASAADKQKALLSAMNALNPTKDKAEAMKQWGDQVRSAADAAAGIDGSAFDLSGKFDASSEAGGKLYDVLNGLATTAADVAASGGDMTKVAREQDQIFEQLAASTGRTKEEIKAIYDSIGGNVVDIAVKLKGAPEAIQQLGTIKAAMDANPDLKEFRLKAEGSEQVRAALDMLKIKMTTTPDGKIVKVDLTGDAGAKLQAVIDATAQIPAGKEVKVNAPGGQAVFDLLKAMNVATTSDNDKNIVADIPNGSPVLELLKQIGYEVETRNGKQIIVKANDDDYQGKKDEWTAPAYKTLYVNATVAGMASTAGVMDLSNAIPHADGAIVPYVDGGIAASEAFANGGLKEIRKPRRADIFQGRGAGTIFAEEETGGEAYIPLAASKRKRSTDILATVAERFGLGLVRKYADGGIASADDLKRLAMGDGARMPLTGAPYDWGGVNWGDCSGAMSAFARRAVGLPPFGGRFATGNEGEYLAQLGFQTGSWTPGTLGIGWVNGGPGGGHTAGTLPDGTNVEMGGSYGGGMVGGTVGANDGQFTNRAFLPIGKAAPKFDPFKPFQDQYVPDPNYRPGQQSGSYGSSTAEQPKGASLSERLGNAASAFVSGQVQSLLGVLSVNDSPGVLAAINEYESQRSQSKSQSQGPVTDPGTTKPQEGEDTGASAKAPDTPAAPAALTGVEAIKAAFKQGLREAWRTGVEWDASDWIVGKESNWDPKARNPSSGAFGLGQWLGSTKDQYLPDENPDPTVQGKAFDAYVNDRYELPTKAKAHWDQEGWYDVGGVIHEGTTLVKNGLGHKETALPFDPHDLKKSLDRSSDDRVLERLDRLIALTERMNERIGEGGDTFNWTSSGNSKQDMDEVQRARRVAKLAGV
ncbi:tape measure protein [Gordonia sp. YC-JH1]|nr:tape measure protein [Gordonia sp. YC-JH1]AUH68525.1 hypothetical protein CXX93_09370 [Gordonia sp. YC-JH1]